MEADPQIPDAYRQECYAGQAEDTAWVVKTNGSVTVPYGKPRHVLTTLESTRIERRRGVEAAALPAVTRRTPPGLLHFARNPAKLRGLARVRVPGGPPAKSHT